MRSAALNPHDIWTLRGVGHPADRLPIVLGCEAAGLDESGRRVVIHPVFGNPNNGGGDETLDPERAILSETSDGALAEEVVVPQERIVPLPEGIGMAEAGALGITWGTAYRMLFTRGHVRPGMRVLVQGSAGGVASAAIALASRAGAIVTATARTDDRAQFALDQGATEVIAPGTRLRERVDVVIETVGEATWSHSLRALRPGGAVVVAGATTGSMPSADLQLVFYRQLRIIGSTGCTLSEFKELLSMLVATGLRPPVETLTFDEIPDGFRRIIDGSVLGKLVVDPTR